MEHRMDRTHRWGLITHFYNRCDSLVGGAETKEHGVEPVGQVTALPAMFGNYYPVYNSAFRPRRVADRACAHATSRARDRLRARDHARPSGDDGFDWTLSSATSQS